MKLTRWQLQEAKNKFSEVVRKATEEGPQTVTKHGTDSVVIISAEDYKRIEQPEENLVDFFQNSLFASVKLELDRDKSPARDVSL
jgi:prevent-host-death family protein